ncbi:MAG: hypothetical protein ACYC1U_06855 [Candidatus Aquicultorales bacterium]
MARGGIVWQVSPAKLKPKIDAYGDKVLKGIYAIGQYITIKMESDARLGAHWTDRTGNARKMLRGEIEAAAEYIMTLYLVHGVDYGLWLEVAHGGQYAIIMEVLEPNTEELMAMIRRYLA